MWNWWIKNCFNSDINPFWNFRTASFFGDYIDVRKTEAKVHCVESKQLKTKFPAENIIMGEVLRSLNKTAMDLQEEKNGETFE